jgi:hypothetical protein
MGRANLATTEAMGQFIESLDGLTEEQLLGMAAAWGSVDEQARADAWTQVRAVAAKEGLGRDVDQIRERAMEWATRGTDPGWPYALDAGDLSRKARKEAAPAVVDAAIAIALDDWLDESTRDVLLGPWRRVSDEG